MKYRINKISINILFLFHCQYPLKGNTQTYSKGHTTLTKNRFKAFVSSSCQNRLWITEMLYFFLIVVLTHKREMSDEKKKQHLIDCYATA